MSMRRRMARFNRAAANPLIGRIVTATPGFGAVIHRGRRSGREYRTPVMVFRDGGRYVIALPYGSDSDWVRNTLAAGGCDLLTHGRRIRMVEPAVYTDDERAGVPALVRQALRLAGANEFMSLRPAETPVASAEEGGHP
jgi:deazaflavin-dependent oxidoreductase (nitroreductase family)